MASVVGDNQEHVACFAHLLQLVVRDGLSVISLSGHSYPRAAKLPIWVHQSDLFRGEFESVIGPGKSIPSTYNTRWNSSFRQLNAFLSLDLNVVNKLLCDNLHVFLRSKCINNAFAPTHSGIIGIIFCIIPLSLDSNVVIMAGARMIGAGVGAVGGAAASVYPSLCGVQLMELTVETADRNNAITWAQ